jgi:hypothetical protein
MARKTNRKRRSTRKRRRTKGPDPLLKRRPGITTGRPLKDLPEADIARWARAGASIRLLAALAHCDPKTIVDRFPSLVSQNDALGKAELLEVQHEVALRGDAGMLKYLGRTRLGQVDAEPDETLPDLPASGEYIVSLKRRVPSA